VHGIAVGLGAGATVGTGVGAGVATGIGVAGTGVGFAVAAGVLGAEGAEAAAAPPHAASPNVAMVDSKNRRESMSMYSPESERAGGLSRQRGTRG
jgi:hypothetical protein